MYDKQIYYIRASLKICPEGIKISSKKRTPSTKLNWADRYFFLILLIGYKEEFLREHVDDVLTKLGHLAFLILHFAFDTMSH